MPDNINAPDPRVLPPPNMLDVERAMWHFFTPVEERADPIKSVPHVIHKPTQQEDPPSVDPNMSEHLAAHLPPWVSPDYWSDPWDRSICRCCTFYATSTVLYTEKMPEMRMGILQGVSYSILSGLNQFDIFEIAIKRDGELLAKWEDMFINPLSPNPAHQYAFGGHISQIPVFGLFDRNQTLTVEITILGAYPFVKTPADPFTGTMCVYVHGWKPTIMDNRDGAPRPVDMGYLNEVTDGWEGPINSEVKKRAYEWLQFYRQAQ